MHAQQRLKAQESKKNWECRAMYKRKWKNRSWATAATTKSSWRLRRMRVEREGRDAIDVGYGKRLV
jgi:hypothetical protein